MKLSFFYLYQVYVVLSTNSGDGSSTRKRRPTCEPTFFPIVSAFHSVVSRQVPQPKTQQKSGTQTQNTQPRSKIQPPKMEPKSALQPPKMKPKSGMLPPKAQSKSELQPSKELQYPNSKTPSAYKKIDLNEDDVEDNVIAGFTNKHYIVTGMFIFCLIAAYSIFKKYSVYYMIDHKVGNSEYGIKDVEVSAYDELNPFIVR